MNADSRRGAKPSRAPDRAAATADSNLVPAPGWPAPIARAAPWLARAVAAAVPLAAAFYYLRQEWQIQGRLGFPMDDPYIHFQFARNLAAGAGFAFNPGEPTPGATSPLWVVLLALGRVLGAPIEPLALTLGILAAAAAAMLTFETGRAAGLRTPLAFVAALAVGGAGRFAWAALSGMEICLATALSLLLLRLHLSPAPRTPRRTLALGLLAGLCAQVRPELALLALLVGCIEGRRASRGAEPHHTLRTLALYATGFALIAAPYLIFCLATTGRPFPNTYYAKTWLPLFQAGSPLPTLRAAYLPEMARWIWSDNAWMALLFPLGLLYWWRRPTPCRAAAVALWPLFFWAYALALFPRHLNASRYTIPLLPCLALVAMAPLEWLLARLDRAPNARRVAACTASVLIAVAALRGQLDGYALYQSNVDNILKMQVRMAEWAARTLPPGARVATNDVGAITFYGRRYCIDTLGLVSGRWIDQLLRWKKERGQIDIEAALPPYLAQQRAEYLIVFPDWYPNLTSQPWLHKLEEIDYPNSTGGGNALVAYQVTREQKH